MTGRPASARAFAVPPVETSSSPAFGQSAGEVDQAGFVRNTQNCTHIMSGRFCAATGFWTHRLFLTQPGPAAYYAPALAGPPWREAPGASAS